ncbi:MAG: hypothetical protein ABMA01_02380, partial [Chthoniobacteraceae bacterium]
YCATEDLLPLRGVHALVISDCEGFEYQLFTSAVIEAMDRSIVIVETHPYVDGGDNAALVRAFERTHSIQMIISETGNRLSREEYAPYLREEEFARAVDEYRPAAQQWLCAAPLRARA